MTSEAGDVSFHFPGGATVMIISFAWTTPAVVLGEKCETRRDWTPATIKSVRKAMEKGELVDAFSKSARFGGKAFGKVRILKLVEDEDSSTIKAPSWRAEGFHVLQAIGSKIGKSSAADVWKFWLEENTDRQTVVHFELVELNAHGEELRLEAERALSAAGGPVSL